ncbi:MAG TPA: EAL domain-containing protein [Allosphingosinicella sp.]
MKGWVGKLVDVGEARTAAGRALLEERYAALLRQIPLLYVVALTNFVGLQLATDGDLVSPTSPSMILCGFVCARLLYWLRARGRRLTPEQIVRQLWKIWFNALLISLGFCLWALTLLKVGNPQYEGHILLFGTLAGVGCAYGLSSFPGAARLPLVFLALPLAVRLFLSPQPAHFGMGVSIILIILLILHLLHVHHLAFTELVRSRSEIAEGRERALRAERLAKAAKSKAKRVADTDPLTGLPNRRAFLRALGKNVAALERGGGGFALAMLDLDGFKPVNDTFGHGTGDRLLERIGERLSSGMGGGAMIARTGGDEFAMILPGVGTAEAAEAAGAAICVALKRPYVIEGREFRISGCCGVTLLTRDDCDVEQALIRADTALYRAKEGGRAGVAVFSEEMHVMHRRRAAVEKALRLPETQDRIGLVFQPITDLATGELRAFEALARWEDDTLGRIAPDQFIPIAEQISVIQELSQRLLAKAAVQAGRWADSVKLSFNLSAVQLCTAGSSEQILTVLDQARLSPHRLQVEVTETALLADFEAARDNLSTLRNAGTRIVLDDFGAGHASISYLREMQFDGVKLDGALIAGSEHSLRQRRLLKGVLDLCTAMGLPSVAEHIETEEQLALLRQLGCRDGQGYLLSRPLDADAAAEMASARLVKFQARRRAA